MRPNLTQTDARSYARRRRAKSEPLEAADWRELSRDSMAQVREAVARRADAPIDILNALTRDRTVRVRVAVAEHPSVPTAALEWLAVDQVPVVRAAAAATIRTLAFQQELSRDRSWNVRAALARNPALARELVKKLRSDPKIEVVEALAESTEDRDLQEVLMLHDRTRVRAAVARNPKLCVRWLVMLTHDRIQSAALAARRLLAARPMGCNCGSPRCLPF